MPKKNKKIKINTYIKVSLKKNEIETYTNKLNISNNHKK